MEFNIVNEFIFIVAAENTERNLLSDSLWLLISQLLYIKLFESNVLIYVINLIR